MPAHSNESAWPVFICHAHLFTPQIQQKATFHYKNIEQTIKNHLKILEEQKKLVPLHRNSGFTNRIAKQIHWDMV